MKQIKVGLYALGIGALIFTVLNILWMIQHSVVWWNIVLQWPMKWYGIFYLVLTRPLSLLQMPIVAYLQISIAILSPFIAIISARRFGFSSIGQVLWFIITFLFPFTLLLMATMPSGNIEIVRKRLSVAAAVLLVSLFWIGVGLFSVIASGSGDVVYIVGARWIGTDNPVINTLIVGMGFFFASLGIAGIISAVLVALGIMKPETLERMFREFS